ncbi:MAG: glycosyltransferase family 32 protein [Winogradskyella sp.]|uniref:glycosyltransferase family 32 protein n=1 Tax=Winogradskyella sp. TaxID=1883156 RepID=UPI00385B07CC
MIPKVIHYCWFGKNPMSKVILKCIESWKFNLPDFELKLWNETNFEFTHPFVKKAYEDKKWAFVSDYVRLKVLYDYGGVYLDTDMLVLRDFTELLDHQCFVGIESDRYISCGVIGAQKGHSYITNCLRYYDKVDVLNPIDYKVLIIPKIFTSVFKAHYNNSEKLSAKRYDDIVVCDVNSFYPYPNPNPNVRRKDNEYLQYITEASFAVHLWDRSWIGFSEFELIRQKRYFKALSLMLQNGNKMKFEKKKYYSRLLSTIKASILE